MQTYRVIGAGITISVQLFLLNLVWMVEPLDRQLEGNVWESIDTWRPMEQAGTVYISLESMMVSSGALVSLTPEFGRS